MRKSITISLPEEMEAAVDEFIREEGISRSELIRESLHDYLYFRKLKKTRETMLRKAEARGVFTNEDVFRLV